MTKNNEPQPCPEHRDRYTLPAGRQVGFSDLKGNIVPLKQGFSDLYVSKSPFSLHCTTMFLCGLKNVMC